MLQLQSEFLLLSTNYVITFAADLCLVLVNKNDIIGKYILFIWFHSTESADECAIKKLLLLKMLKTISQIQEQPKLGHYT